MATSALTSPEILISSIKPLSLILGDLATFVTMPFRFLLAKLPKKYKTGLLAHVVIALILVYSLNYLKWVVRLLILIRFPLVLFF